MTVIMSLMVTLAHDAGAPKIVVVEQAAGLGLRRVRVRDRLAARIRRSTLDRELAAGASPESSVDLAVHARFLCRPEQRRVLGCTLTEIVAASETPSARRSRVPLCRTAISQAHAELEAVVGRLVAPGPVGVRGVARIRSLLADGTGPLYRESGAGHLRQELVAALRAFDSLG